MYDALIVLAGGVNQDGTLSTFTSQRVERAVEIYKKKHLPLIMTGRWSFILPYVPARTEAQGMRELAVRQGVTDEIFLEEQSCDTLSNAYFTRIIVDKHGWKNLAIVTSDFHIPRTQWIFSHVFGPTYTVQVIPAPTELSLAERKKLDVQERKIMDVTQKLWGTIKEGDLDGTKKMLFSDHPGYAKHPAITKEELLKIVA